MKKLKMKFYSCLHQYQIEEINLHEYQFFLLSLTQYLYLYHLLTIGPTTSTSTLLSASKRKLESYEPKLGDWNSLFTKSGIDMKEIGMAVKERRYLLRLLESYR